MNFNSPHKWYYKKHRLLLMFLCGNFLASAFGAQLVVAEPEVHQHPQQLAQIIDKYQISVIHFVPSMLKTFIEQTNLKNS